jgi:hypothetical protein
VKRPAAVVLAAAAFATVAPSALAETGPVQLLTAPVEQVTNSAADAATPVVDTASQTAVPLVAPVVEDVAQTAAPMVAPVTGPVVEVAHGATAPVLKTVAPVVETVERTAAPITKPVEAAVAPVLETATRPVEPITVAVTQRATPIAGPASPVAAATQSAEAPSTKHVASVSTAGNAVASPLPVADDAAIPGLGRRFDSLTGSLRRVGLAAMAEAGQQLPAGGTAPMRVLPLPQPSVATSSEAGVVGHISAPPVPSSPGSLSGLVAAWSPSGPMPLFAALLVASLLAIPLLFRRLLPVGERAWTPVALVPSAPPG